MTSRIFTLAVAALAALMSACPAELDRDRDDDDDDDEEEEEEEELEEPVEGQRFLIKDGVGTAADTELYYASLERIDVDVDVNGLDLDAWKSLVFGAEPR